MRPGAVIVDVSIDHGGCFETSKVTTHQQPVFKKYDVIHYCVPNIPSGFARTASQAISNVLMPLLLETAEDGGIENAVSYTHLDVYKRQVRNTTYPPGIPEYIKPTVPRDSSASECAPIDRAYAA